MAEDAINDAAIDPDEAEGRIVVVPSIGKLHQSAANAIHVDGLVGLHISRNWKNQSGLQVDGLSELAGLDGIPTGELKTDFGKLLNVEVRRDVHDWAGGLNENEAGIGGDA